MRVFITGASGFLGSRLAAAWEARGHEVRGSGSRRPPGVRGDVRPLPLGQRVDPARLAGVEVLVHAAHAFGRGSHEVTIAGTRAMHAAGRGAGVRRQVFISSCSAFPDAPDDYGRTKHALERFFLDAGETIVRPGLVVGDGGRFGHTISVVLRHRVIPLVDGGKDLLPVVGIGDFVAAMTAILEHGLGGSFNLFNDRLVTMRELLGTLAGLAGRRRLFPRIPGWFAAGALAGLERLGLPLPAGGAGSLQALKRNRPGMHGGGDLARLLGRESSLEEMLAAALGERSARGA